ncbi:MAG: ketopantoate reductase family protein, partial [Alphaproteobacteria bacterium]
PLARDGALRQPAPIKEIAMTSAAEQSAIRDAVDHGPILIWGAGAIGGTIGAALVRARHAVVFVDIVEDHVAAIRDPAVGLTIEGPVDAHRISAPAYTPETLKGQFRRVLLCVKAQDTEAACRAIAPHLAPDGYVVSLQNGLCDALIAPILGEARTIGCFVNFSADWLAPGRIIYGGRGALVLGELNGAVTPRLTALHRMLRDHFEADAIMTENIWGYLWGKIATAPCSIPKRWVRKALPMRWRGRNCCRFGGGLVRKPWLSRAPRVLPLVASMVLTRLASRLTQPKHPPPLRLPPWWHSIAPMQKPIPASGAIYGCAGAARPWMRKSRLSWGLPRARLMAGLLTTLN